MSFKKTLIIITVIVGCKNISHDRKSIDSIPSKEEDSYKLLLVEKFKMNFITEDGGHMDEYYVNKSLFIQKYLNVKYNDKTIMIDVFTEHNSCGAYEGQSKLKNDTIFLSMKDTSDLNCASSVFSVISYTVHSNSNKKYAIFFDNLCVSCLYDARNK